MLKGRKLPSRTFRVNALTKPTKTTKHLYNGYKFMDGNKLCKWITKDKFVVLYHLRNGDEVLAGTSGRWFTKIIKGVKPKK